MDVVRRLLAAFLLLALAAAAVYGYTVTRRQRLYERYIAQGETAVGQDNSFAAIEAFSGAMALKNDSMLPNLRRGEVYRRRGDLEAAMRDLRRASELDPAAPRPLEALGDVNFALAARARDADERTAGYARAADRYRDYVRLDDRSPRVLYKLALALYSAGQPADAVPALHKAVALKDNSAEAYYLLGLCLRDAHQVDDARKAFERSIEIQPGMLRAREELADLDAAMGRTDARLTQLEALCALDPGATREITLGLAYAQARQSDRAVLTLGRAAERYPDHPYTYVALGRVWLERAQASGDRISLSKAIEALEGAVGTDESSEAYTLFGRALLMASDEESAERMLDAATRKEPVDPLAYYYLADAAERLGHISAARRALLDYRTLRGAESDARRELSQEIRLGDLSLKLNEPAAAAAYFQKSADAGGETAALTRLADALWRAGDKDAARTTIARILEKEPRNPQAVALRRLIGG